MAKKNARHPPSPRQAQTSSADTPARRSAPFPVWFWMGFAGVALGQGLIVWGGALGFAIQLVVAPLLALAGGWWAARRSDELDREILATSQPPRRWLYELLPTVLLVAMSVFNFASDRIGFAEDEILEFLEVGPAFDRPWLWWLGVNETLTSNLTAWACRWLPIRFETIKFVAFVARTTAGLLLWGLARELFGRRVAFWSALALAGSVLYVCSFNTVIKDVSSHMVFLACLYATLRGLRTGGRRWLFAGGLAAGLAAYTYPSKYGLWATLVVAVPVAFWLRDSVYNLRVHARRLWIWLAGAVLLAAPHFYYLLKYPAASFNTAHARNQSSLIAGGLPLLIKDTWTDTLAIVHRGDPWFTNNFNNEPALWWPWAILFWLGLGAMLRRWRETRAWLPLLFMAALIGLAGMNCLYTPNWKLSRTAMLLAFIPAGIGAELLIRRLTWGRGTAGWALVAVIALLAAGRAVVVCGEQARHPASWWFRAMTPMAPREAFVRAHDDCRFIGIGVALTDVRPGSPMLSLHSLRQLLETPGDGRDVMFMFPAGRQEWEPRIQALVRFWTALYPGGQLQRHFEPVRGGNWPVFITYRIPAARYWALPPVDPTNESRSRMDRAQVLLTHGLQQEAWREGMRAIAADAVLAQRVDAMLGNRDGADGRLRTLVGYGLYDEARRELARLYASGALPTAWKDWHRYLDQHGLEFEVFGTYEPSGDIVQTGRLYSAEVALGMKSFVNGPSFHFAMRATGGLWVETPGTYRFEVGSPLWRCSMKLDGEVLFEFSETRCDAPPSREVVLTRGAHRLEITVLPPMFRTGRPPVPLARIEPLNGRYGFDSHWAFKWQIGNSPMVSVPASNLLAPDADYVPMPELPQAQGTP